MQGGPRGPSAYMQWGVTCPKSPTQSATARQAALGWDPIAASGQDASCPNSVGWPTFKSTPPLLHCPPLHRGDPNAADQETFCPSSAGWPAFMRVNPILDWSYHDVWAFLQVLLSVVPFGFSRLPGRGAVWPACGSSPGVRGCTMLCGPCCGYT